MTNAIISHKSSHSRLRWSVAALAVMVMVPATALASTKVSGSPQSVTVETKNGSIKDVFVALGHNFKLHVRSSADLDKQVAGTYRGSLQAVVARLLEGYNFILREDQGTLDVTVLGTPNGSTTAHNQWTLGGANDAGADRPSAQSAAAQGAKVGTAPASPNAQPTAPSKPAQASAQAALDRSAGPQQIQPSGPAPTTPLLKLADGSGPMPMPSSSSASGPTPGPATVSMPTPQKSSATPTLMPNPTSASNATSLPMPTSSSPVPGLAPQTGGAVPGSSPAANDPSATSGAPNTPSEPPASKP